MSNKTKDQLRQTRELLDPMELSEEIESKLKTIHQIIERIEEERAEELSWASEASAVAGSVPALVAPAPSASTPPATAKRLAKTAQKKQKTTNSRVS
ncbi:MAG: hypothetical protein ACPG32_02450 [Akkermansiaceae bacterium]